ncbi:MAG: NAD(P)H-dependent oxidoreductase [Lachnospira sp.]|nr:NAD(P)H-dependent oxidoreductase [Lachnospira sp.]
MKKLICIMVTFVMALGLFTGCGATADSKSTGNNSEANNNSTISDVKGEESTVSGTASNTSSTGKKTLVVYYSATGSTKAVAQTIAQTADADIFEITPVNLYTSDDLNWNNKNSRVSKEHNDESLRNVELTKVIPDNWESYDTVFIGYPIWWWIAAWPVNNFVKGNNFTGKTVIPFCTSSSSGIGDSGNLLQKMAGTGNWQEGQRFSSGASSSEVSNWVKSLKLSK